MGNAKQGLQLLIEKMGDVKQAIEFIESQNDQDLWEDLIESSMKNADFISSLLEHIGGASSYVDPIKVIKRIPDGIKINNLRDRIVKIISDYNLQVLIIVKLPEFVFVDVIA